MRTRPALLCVRSPAVLSRPRAKGASWVWKRKPCAPWRLAFDSSSCGCLSCPLGKDIREQAGRRRAAESCGVSAFLPCWRLLARWGPYRDLPAPAALLFCPGLRCPALPELLCCGGQLNSSAFPVFSAGAGVLNVFCGEPRCLSALPRAREEGLGKKATLWLFPGVLSGAGWFESRRLES